MKIKNYKEKSKKISVLLIIAGIIITISGFSIVSFDMSKLKEKGSHKWYRTIHIDKNYCSFGINFPSK